MHDFQDSEIIEVNPRNCKRWEFSDRIDLEFQKIDELAEDIMTNGQISPVLIRAIDDPKLDYEILAGARRWKACLAADIPLRAILTTYNDQDAAIAQIKENAKHTLSNFSKGMSYNRLLKSKIITQRQLADSLGISRSKLQSLLCFSRFPERLLEAIESPERISARSANSINFLCKKGEQHIDALIEIAPQIKDGLSSYNIEEMVKNIVDGKGASLNEDIKNNRGEVIARWRMGSLIIRAKHSSDRQKLTKLVELFLSS